MTTDTYRAGAGGTSDSRQFTETPWNIHRASGFLVEHEVLDDMRYVFPLDSFTSDDLLRQSASKLAHQDDVLMMYPTALLDEYPQVEKSPRDALNSQHQWPSRTNLTRLSSVLVRVLKRQMASRWSGASSEVFYVSTHHDDSLADRIVATRESIPITYRELVRRATTGVVGTEVFARLEDD